MLDKAHSVNNYTFMSNMWKTRIECRQVLSGDLAETLSEALEDLAAAVALHNLESTDGDNWTLTLTTVGKPDAGEILRRIELVKPGLADRSGIIAEKLPETDWLQHVHDHFPPIRIGRFFIYGSHYTGEHPAGLVPLQIDAATAFGSGEHETTRGCIQAFEFLKKSGNDFKNALDMGCGSGILAIAMTKLWPGVRVTAIDIDPESVVVANRHAAMNGVTGQISADAGDGYKTPMAEKNASYGLIAANILADPLIAMAPELAAVLTPGGFCVLSGLLKRQKSDVAAAHEKSGLRLVHAEEMGEWQALVFQKPAS